VAANAVAEPAERVGFVDHVAPPGECLLEMFGLCHREQLHVTAAG
jgi:hypothetical protein